MKWSPKAPVDRTGWHKWFAWYPVYCGNINKWVWLENVEYIIEYGTYDDFPRYRYV